MTELLDSDSAAAALRSLVGAVEKRGITPVEREYRFYRPFSASVDDFIEEAQDTQRIYTGIHEFDEQMRGVGRKHLCLIVGYSHSGKTLVFTKILSHNAQKRICFFTPDEPDTLVLAKLASLSSGVDARELEKRIQQGDTRTITLLRAVASEEYPNLIVFDTSIHLDGATMNRAYEEACDVWGDEADMCALDYVELLNAGETVPQKMDFIKGFTGHRRVPFFAMHQTSRSAGAKGRKMDIDSGSFGGEQHATFMIGVRRKKAGIIDALNELQRQIDAKGQASDAQEQQRDDLQYELRKHEWTLSTNLVKNKRVGGGLVDEIDFEIEHGTGYLRPLNGDLPRSFIAASKAALESHTPTSYDNEEMF